MVFAFVTMNRTTVYYNYSYLVRNVQTMRQVIQKIVKKLFETRFTEISFVSVIARLE